jgi:predicted peptidase
MKRLAEVVFAMTLAAAPVMAQDTIDGFQARQYRNAAGQIMPYRLFVPASYDQSTKYPLILWLHGAGGAGTDNRRQISDDQVPGTRLWTKQQNQRRHPAFVLVPQSRVGWAGQPELQSVLEILSALEMEFHIDESRVYILGQSNGGIGAWDLITRQPGLFAAAVLVCAAGSFPNRAAAVAQLPIWVFQGAKDNAGFVMAARSMIGEIRSAGGNPRYTEYAGAGHDIWNRVFKEPGLVDWLFEQKR